MVHRPWWETISEVPESEQMNFMLGERNLTQYSKESVVQTLVAGWLGAKWASGKKKN